MRDFKDFQIWHLGMEIVVDIYQVSNALPDTERYGLQSQMRRSAVSMPSNIAEGRSRRSDKAFANFLEIALGSAFELQTQLIVATRIGYLGENQLNALFELLDKFQRKTSSLLGKMIR